MGRYAPDHRRKQRSGAQYRDGRSQSQMQQREYSQHDRHRHQRRSRNDHEHHVDQETQGDGREQRRQPNSVRSQESHDRIGERCRAEHEFLALIDIVFDGDPAGTLIGPTREVEFEREIGVESDQPGRHHQQRTGCQESNENPCAAWRALAMIKQQWQHQQFHGRTDRIETFAPRRIRPQGSNQRQSEQCDRQNANRTRQRSQKYPYLDRWNQRDHPEHRDNHDAGRRPGQQ